MYIYNYIYTYKQTDKQFIVNYKQYIRNYLASNSTKNICSNYMPYVNLKGFSGKTRDYHQFPSLGSDNAWSESDSTGAGEGK